MIDRKHAVYTQSNNVLGNINVLYAIKVGGVGLDGPCPMLSERAPYLGDQLAPLRARALQGSCVQRLQHA